MVEFLTKYDGRRQWLGDSRVFRKRWCGKVRKPDKCRYEMLIFVYLQST